MQWLAFDTSTEALSIGVAAKGHTDVRTLAGGAQSSATLIPTAMEMLSQAGIGLPQLDAIVFGRGPGSFTGLRTACAVAQGLAFGADILVLPVDTLLAVAEEARVLAGVNDQPLTVLAMLDARMDEVYSAAWDWDGQRWTLRQPLQVGGPQHVLLPDAPRVLLAGNAFEAYGERLPAGERVQALPTAAALLRLAPSLFADGHAVPAEQAMPLYIRDKVAQTTAERMAEREAAKGAP
ncbi:tRNA (adenosine(37)-N6)-threonylcarbamoyltransferase complex dimerization subunit type 1 TsaB [Limnohabitans sp.]|uniref:tRNA (adenosine(37)-N6)-threonylcarbamoyltransferase complex dimerization subunit type 1 TsaB n=1 Tax=Limnohabitans sp. TaxID=1907725 RepID=UPI0035ADCFD4